MSTLVMHTGGEGAAASLDAAAVLGLGVVVLVAVAYDLYRNWSGGEEWQ